MPWLGYVALLTQSVQVPKYSGMRLQKNGACTACTIFWDIGHCFGILGLAQRVQVPTYPGNKLQKPLQVEYFGTSEFVFLDPMGNKRLLLLYVPECQLRVRLNLNHLESPKLQATVLRKKRPAKAGNPRKGFTSYSSNLCNSYTSSSGFTAPAKKASQALA